MSGYIYLKRRERFSASHRLHAKQLTDEENKKVYGICNNKNGHGHNYVINITLKGKADPVTGMIINLKELKHIINNEVIDKFDHKHLDLDCEEFKNIPSTIENIAIVIWNILEKKLNGLLYKIEAIETENNSATYYGPEAN